jgi:hypothetical protein
MELSKQEMEIFFLFPIIGSKNKSIPSRAERFQNSIQKQEMELYLQEMELSKQEMELFLPFPVIRSTKAKAKTKVFPFGPFGQKQDMELFKQEMEIFLPFPVIESKNFFNKSIPNWSNDFKMVDRNRKWNFLNRKWNFLSPFQSLDQKTSLTKVFPYGPAIPKWFSETGNGFI